MENDNQKPEPKGKFAEVHKKSKELRDQKDKARREELDKAAIRIQEEDAERE